MTTRIQTRDLERERERERESTTLPDISLS
jgi:hypothetical protein